MGMTNQGKGKATCNKKIENYEQNCADYKEIEIRWDTQFYQSETTAWMIH
jgi:hypothetical protein